jgi:hypothetical protein
MAKTGQLCLTDGSGMSHNGDQTSDQLTTGESRWQNWSAVSDRWFWHVTQWRSDQQLVDQVDQGGRSWPAVFNR